MANLINTTDSLNTGRTKINTAIADAEKALTNADAASAKATMALGQSGSTQAQLDEIILLNGQSDAEVLQAHVDYKGVTHASLKARNDVTEEKLDTEISRKKSEKNAQIPLVIPTYEGSGQTVHPSVVFVSARWNGYEYWMAHTPYPETNDDFENPSISVSTDGINWINLPGLTNPIDQPTAGELVELYHMSDTELILVNGTMECWYRFNKNSGTEQIMRKKSTDGVNWTAREVVLDLTGSGNWSLSPAVIYEDGKYKLWFVGSGSKIYYTESTTGAAGTWSAITACTIGYRDTVYTPWHIDIIHDGAIYYAIINTTSALGKRCLLLAESTDGLAWTDAHVIMEAPETGWDSKELYRA
jgi:hypothetical protein